MNSCLSFAINLLICSMIFAHFISSATFPSPPVFPSPDASPEEWTHFWKLLQNYYAIIARPR